jgi:hypothetical protein
VFNGSTSASKSERGGSNPSALAIKMKLKKILKHIQYADIIRMNPKLRKLLLKAGWEKYRKA